MDGNPILYNDPLGDKIKLGKGNGLAFNIKIVSSIVWGSIFSSTMRYYTFKLLFSEHTHTLTKNQISRINPDPDWILSPPLPKVVWTVTNEGLKQEVIPASDEEWNQYEKDVIKYRENHPGTDIHRGCGTNIYIKITDASLSGFIAVLAHEFRHSYDFNFGLIPYPDMYEKGTADYIYFTKRSEKRAVQVEKVVAFELNKFRPFSKKLWLRQTYNDVPDREQYTKGQKLKRKRTKGVKNPRRIRKQNRRNKRKRGNRK